MQIKPKHIIHKLSCEVKTSNTQTAQLIKDKLADWLNTELLPIIENYLDKMDDNAGLIHYQIPEIKLDLNSQHPLFEGSRGMVNHQSSDQLLQQIQKQFEQQLQLVRKKIAEDKLLEPKKNGHVQNMASTALWTLNQLDREVKTISYLLINGSRPWWMSNHEKSPRFFSDWSQRRPVNEILEHKEFRHLLKQVPRNTTLRKRLIYQFSFWQNQIMFDQYIQSEFDVKMDSKLVNSLKKDMVKNLKIPVWDFLWSIDRDTDLRQDFLKLVKILHAKAAVLSDAEKIDAQNFLKTILELLSLINKTVKVRLDDKIYLKLKHEEIISIEQFHQLLNISESNHNYSSNGNSILKDDLDKILSTPISKKFEDTSQTIKDPNGQNEVDQSGLHVEQAGLILLHPFLKEFFLQTQLLNPKNEFVDLNKAVLLLHYLATKEESAFDHELIFEKFCCGLPMEAPIDREIKLSEKEKAQAEELLNEVIGHWTALKGTGADTLRAEFLCRNGKLVHKGKYPKLILERKTQDILLDKLPWGIGMAKFPWKKELLFVEW